MDATDRATIEQLRQRLATLDGNLKTFHHKFLEAEPDKLPSWDAIHGSQRALVTVLKALQDLLGNEERTAFLKSAHLHPTAKFPQQQEIALTNLLRKKLDPEIVTWVNEGRVAGTALGSDEKNKIDYEELWDWAAPAANRIIREVFVTRSEEDEEGDEDEDDEMDTSEDKTKAPTDGPPMELGELLRYTVSGKKRR